MPFYFLILGENYVLLTTTAVVNLISLPRKTSEKRFRSEDFSPQIDLKLIKTLQSSQETFPRNVSTIIYM